MLWDATENHIFNVRDLLHSYLGNAEDEGDVTFAEHFDVELFVEQIARELVKGSWGIEEHHIDALTMGFGKYRNVPLADVPLAYLDHIYRTLDDSWFKRRLREFLDRQQFFMAFVWGTQNLTANQFRKYLKERVNGAS